MNLVIGILIFLILILLWCCYKCFIGCFSITKTPETTAITETVIPNNGDIGHPIKTYYDNRGVKILSEVEFNKLSDGERFDYLVKKYFKNIPVGNKKMLEFKKMREDDEYLKSLPRDSSCPDQFDKCAVWADNGECRVNPAFMLFGCPGSCASCKLTEGQKYKVANIRKSRKPEHCVFRGEEYPSLVRMELEQIFGII